MLDVKEGEMSDQHERRWSPDDSVSAEGRRRGTVSGDAVMTRALLLVIAVAVVVMAAVMLMDR